MAQTLTAADAQLAWLEHLQKERRASDRTLEAYRACASAYLDFLQRHRGAPVTLGDLGVVSASDLRAYLASRRGRRRRPRRALGRRTRWIAMGRCFASNRITHKQCGAALQR